MRKKALVIGTSALLSPELPVMLSNMNFLSRDSRCYSFDARANGYARGEGVVALVIKPLAGALESGDVIRGVVGWCSASRIPYLVLC